MNLFWNWPWSAFSWKAQDNAQPAELFCEFSKNSGDVSGPDRLLANAHALKQANHFVAEVRQLIGVVQQRQCDAGEASLAEVGDLRGDEVWIADDRQSAHALRILTALEQVFFHPHSLRRDILQSKDEAYSLPVGLFDDAVVEVFLSLLLGRPAGHDADRVTADLAALIACGCLCGANLLLRVSKRRPRCLQEEGIAVFDCERLSGRRRARIHDHRTCSTERLRLAADSFHMEVLAVEVEIFAVGPD